MILKYFYQIPLALFCLLLAACNPPPELNSNPYRGENRFPQDFKNTNAYLVIEWNGRKPWIMASGNLIDREKGIFSTAKHFTDEFGKLGVDYCMVFFNGKVYKATLVRVPPIRDAALIRLVPPFSPDDFPELLPVASQMPKLGDEIYIQGFHPHSYEIRMSNKEDGFPDTEVQIFGTYYIRVMKDTEKESQVVYDNLKGKVVAPKPDPLFESKNEYENSQYIKVLTERDHKFSFGGLSGGVAVNSKGEAVGVITAQDVFRFEFDEHGFFITPDGYMGFNVKKQFFDTIYVTPSDSIVDLREYVKSLK